MLGITRREYARLFERANTAINRKLAAFVAGDWCPGYAAKFARLAAGLRHSRAGRSRRARTSPPAPPAATRTRRSRACTRAPEPTTVIAAPTRASSSPTSPLGLEHEHRRGPGARQQGGDAAEQLGAGRAPGARAHDVGHGKAGRHDVERPSRDVAAAIHATVRRARAGTAHPPAAVDESRRALRGSDRPRTPKPSLSAARGRAVDATDDRAGGQRPHCHAHARGQPQTHDGPRHARARSRLEALGNCPRLAAVGR